MEGRPEGPELNGILDGAGQRRSVAQRLHVLDLCVVVQTQEERYGPRGLSIQGVGDIAGAQNVGRRIFWDFTGARPNGCHQENCQENRSSRQGEARFHVHCVWSPQRWVNDSRKETAISQALQTSPCESLPGSRLVYSARNTSITHPRLSL